jgi:hypothetical protein
MGVQVADTPPWTRSAACQRRQPRLGDVCCGKNRDILHNSYPGIDSHLELLDKRGPSYLPLAINKPQISWACRSRQPLVEVDSREITVPITVPTSFRIGYSTWWNGLQLGRVAACARVVGVVGRQKGPLPVARALCMHISPKRIHRIERARVPSAHSSQITEV